MPTIMWAAVITAVVGVAGCASTTMPGSATVAPPTTQTPLLSAQEVAEERFYVDVMDTPGLTSTVPRAELVRVGHGMCEVIGAVGMTRDYVVGELGKTKWGPQVAAVVVDAAHANLCPEKNYVDPVVLTIPASPAPAPAPAGPQTTINGDGTYEVGVDIEPGKYKTAGSAQDSSFSCYWARLKDNGEDIIDNSIQNGPQTVALGAGELFETTRCGTWTRQ